MFRLERLEQLRDVAHAASGGDPVVLYIDRLDAAARVRALDFAAGIAAALDAAVVELRTVPGVAIVPKGDDMLAGIGTRTADQAHENSDDGDDTHQGVENSADREDVALCVLCELRPAVEVRVPSLDVVVMRDGSRARPPAIRMCAHCVRTVTNWRFAVVWCSGCERWGRRGVRSRCGSSFGT